MSSKFLVNAILCTQLFDPWHHLQENNTQTLWLVQSVKILWYDWCQIHTLMWQSNWCEIHTLMQQCDWCKQHATICANIEFDFFFLIQKKVTKKHHQESHSHWYCLLQKKRTVKSCPWGRHSKTILVPGGGGGPEIKQANLQKVKCQGRRDVDLSFELIDK